MPKERIDKGYQYNWRYNLVEYYRGFKNKKESKKFVGMKSGIYRGVKWYEASSTSDTNEKRIEGVD